MIFLNSHGEDQLQHPEIVRLFFRFDPGSGKDLYLKVAISGVNVEGAKRI